MITAEEVRAVMRVRMHTGHRETILASRLGPNPNPSRITHASWWYQGESVACTPDCLNGGIYAPKSGYHSSVEENLARWVNNYSIRHPDDLRGPRDKARGYDKTYRQAQAGRRATIIADCQLLEQAADRRDPRLAGWVEYYGQADSDTAIEGRNFRTGAAISSDSTHDWHVHRSEGTEFVGSWMNKRAMLSLERRQPLQDWIREEGLDMANADDIFHVVSRILETTGGQGRAGAYQRINGPLLNGMETLQGAALELRALVLAGDRADQARDEATTAAIGALVAVVQAGGGSVESAPILAAIHAVRDEARERFVALETELAIQRQRATQAEARARALASDLARALQTSAAPPVLDGDVVPARGVAEVPAQRSIEDSDG